MRQIVGNKFILSYLHTCIITLKHYFIIIYLQSEKKHRCHGILPFSLSLRAFVSFRLSFPQPLNIAEKGAEKIVFFQKFFRLIATRPVRTILSCQIKRRRKFWRSPPSPVSVLSLDQSKFLLIFHDI